MKISQYDCVRLKDGREGTVVELFDKGASLMVEICDDEGRTLDMPIVFAEEIEEITYIHASHNKITDWAKLLTNIYNKEDAVCPECGGNVLGDIYSNDSKVGFAVLQCSLCKKHIKLSRILIPDGAEVKPF